MRSKVDRLQVKDKEGSIDEKDRSKVMLEKATFVGFGNSKNLGGAKQWIFNHYKDKYTVCHTIIYVKFFGHPVGKKN